MSIRMGRVGSPVKKAFVDVNDSFAWKNCFNQLLALREELGVSFEVAASLAHWLVNLHLDLADVVLLQDVSQFVRGHSDFVELTIDLGSSDFQLLGSVLPQGLRTSGVTNIASELARVVKRPVRLSRNLHCVLLQKVPRKRLTLS